jgi:hypothetical protein
MCPNVTERLSATQSCLWGTDVATRSKYKIFVSIVDQFDPSFYVFSTCCFRPLSRKPQRCPVTRSLS